MGNHRRTQRSTGLDCTATVIEVHEVLWIFIRFRHNIIIARAGDLLVCYRLSNYQRISNVNGDPCTHIAMLAIIGDEVVSIEMGPAGVFTRPFAKFAAAYEWIGVIHIDASVTERTTLVAAATRRFSEARMRYSVLQCAHIGAFGLARRVLPGIVEPALRSLAVASARLQFRRSGADVATCSGFIAQCIDEGLADPRPVSWPTRYRVAPWRRAPNVSAISAIAQLRRPALQRGVANILTSPTDLFVTVASYRRTIIGPHEVVVLPGVPRRGSRDGCKPVARVA